MIGYIVAISLIVIYAVFCVYTALLQHKHWNRREYILCAANRYDDGLERVFNPSNVLFGFVICGHRHHNCIERFAEQVGFPYNEEALKIQRTEIQGFLTNKNRFVDRNEAGIIAYQAGQTKKLIKRLHSEDLY